MSEFEFDNEAADRACAFFERYLTHTKGKWATSENGKPQPLKLEQWQTEQIIRPLFGWKRADGTRRYRTCYIRIPRKNGKTTLSAGIALLLLLADREPGAEIYSAAADRDQAAICFDIAKQMVLNSPALSKRTKIFKRAISVPTTGSSYKVLSADAKTKHGFNAHGIVFDELHAQPNRELWDVLTTSTGSRQQPLVVGITTAGHDEQSICYEIDEYACKVRDGILEDPTFLPVIYGAERDDDWTAPEVWRKANPSLGVSITEEYFEQESRKAKESISYLNTFKRLHLNIWTQTETAWLDMEKWKACAGQIDLESLKGADCWAGLDLASKIDLNALSLVFKKDGKFIVLPFFWMPAERAKYRERRDRTPYSAWIGKNIINVTPGDVADYGFIEKRILELAKLYNIRVIHYDPWNATSTATRLQNDHGIPMVEFRQGYASINEPAKELERIVIAGDLIHGNNPALNWMASNVSVMSDPSGNIKPVKPQPDSPKNIDGIVATVMALAGATQQVEEILDIRVI